MHITSTASLIITGTYVLRYTILRSTSVLPTTTYFNTTLPGTVDVDHVVPGTSTVLPVTYNTVLQYVLRRTVLLLGWNFTRSFPLTMTYRPANSGLSKYVLSMLDDEDRNIQYAKAIAECVSTFTAREGRKPRVLDVGVGTGLLSAICLEAGVEHVTSVDVNITMVHMASRHLRELDPSRRRFKVVHVEPGKLPFEAKVRLKTRA